MVKITSTEILKLRTKIGELDGNGMTGEINNQINIAWWALSNAYALIDNRKIDGIGKKLAKVKL